MTEIADKLMDEYVTGKDSYRTLAKKYGVPYRLVAQMGKAQGWPAKRLAHRQECPEGLSESGADFGNVAFELLLKVQAAVRTLDGVDPDLGKIKQLSAILKDMRDMQKDPAPKETGVRVTFVGNTEDFSV